VLLDPFVYLTMNSRVILDGSQRRLTIPVLTDWIADMVLNVCSLKDRVVEMLIKESSRSEFEGLESNKDLLYGYSDVKKSGHVSWTLIVTRRHRSVSNFMLEKTFLGY